MPPQYLNFGKQFNGLGNDQRNSEQACLFFLSVAKTLESGLRDGSKQSLLDVKQLESLDAEEKEKRV